MYDGANGVDSVSKWRNNSGIVSPYVRGFASNILNYRTLSVAAKNCSSASLIRRG